MQDEHQRILSAYEKRDKYITHGFFGYRNFHHFYRVQERYAMMLKLLSQRGITSLTDTRILDIGCGNGAMLNNFVEWGASNTQIAGIDIRENIIEAAQQQYPHLDVRVGNATKLDWADDSFDVITINTVLSSIFDETMRQAIIAEATRALKTNGILIVYDLRYNNPTNPDIVSISKHDLNELLKDYRIDVHSISLAPPISRYLPLFGFNLLYRLLNLLPILRTHYLCIAEKVA